VAEAVPVTERRRAAPAVSVVLPTYRRPDLLERAMASVLAQTFGDWELLVIDDNGLGTEAQRATEAFLRRFAAEPRVVYVPHEVNLGACAARNNGIQAARGRYVAFLDDDDAWYPTKLARQVACFEEADPAVALVYCGFRRVVDGTPGQVVVPDGSGHVWRNLLKRNGIGSTSLVLCRRTALLEVGGFDERLPSKQDIDLYIRLAARFPFAWLGEVLLDKHRHTGEAIGKNYDGVVRANTLFYDKHRSLFEPDRDVHHHRLRSFGHETLRAGRMAEARSLLLRAWWLKPTDVATLALALLINRPLLAAYRGLKRRLKGRPGPTAPPREA
jgi:glycosyltransferase involved in cell wall biosynthesis